MPAPTPDTTDPAVATWQAAYTDLETHTMNTDTLTANKIKRDRIERFVNRYLTLAIAALVLIGTVLIVTTGAADAASKGKPHGEFYAYSHRTPHAMPDPRQYLRCKYEDGPAPCVWRAKYRGNGRGRSYVLTRTHVYYFNGDVVRINRKGK